MMVRRMIYLAALRINGILLRAHILVRGNIQNGFIKRYNLLLKTRKNERDALLGAITLVRYRGPFVKLTDDDVGRLVESSPVLVAKLCQRCVWTGNIKPIREAMPQKYDFSEYAERIYSEMEA